MWPFYPESDSTESDDEENGDGSNNGGEASHDRAGEAALSVYDSIDAFTLRGQFDIGQIGTQATDGFCMGLSDAFMDVEPRAADGYMPPDLPLSYRHQQQAVNDFSVPIDEATDSFIQAMCEEFASGAPIVADDLVEIEVLDQNMPMGFEEVVDAEDGGGGGGDVNDNADVIQKYVAQILGDGDGSEDGAPPRLPPTARAVPKAPRAGAIAGNTKTPPPAKKSMVSRLSSSSSSPTTRARRSRQRTLTFTTSSSNRRTQITLDAIVNRAAKKKKKSAASTNGMKKSAHSPVVPHTTPASIAAAGAADKEDGDGCMNPAENVIDVEDLTADAPEEEDKGEGEGEGEKSDGGEESGEDAECEEGAKGDVTKIGPFSVTGEVKRLMVKGSRQRLEVPALAGKEPVDVNVILQPFTCSKGNHAMTRTHINPPRCGSTRYFLFKFENLPTDLKIICRVLPNADCSNMYSPDCPWMADDAYFTSMATKNTAGAKANEGLFSLTAAANDSGHTYAAFRLYVTSSAAVNSRRREMLMKQQRQQERQQHQQQLQQQAASKALHQQCLQVTSPVKKAAAGKASGTGADTASSDAAAVSVGDDPVLTLTTPGPAAQPPSQLLELPPQPRTLLQKAARGKKVTSRRPVTMPTIDATIYLAPADCPDDDLSQAVLFFSFSFAVTGHKYESSTAGKKNRRSGHNALKRTVCLHPPPPPGK